MKASSQTPLTSEERIKQLEQELAQTRAELADAHAEIDGAHATEADMHAMALTEAKLNQALDTVAQLRGRLESLLNGYELSSRERMRLNGAGTRRYGLTDKISDLMLINPDLIPQYVDEEHLKEVLRFFEISRNIDAILKQCERMNGDIMLTLGDEAFRTALMFYGAVRDASRRNVMGARELFDIMRTFFNHHRKSTEETQRKEISHAKAIIEGKADGEMIIRNERPHLTGGEHEVIDETHKAKVEWKETESGEIDE